MGRHRVPHRVGTLDTNVTRAALVAEADAAAHALRTAAAAYVAAAAAAAARAAHRPYDAQACIEASGVTLARDVQLQTAARAYAFAVDAVAHLIAVQR